MRSSMMSYFICCLLQLTTFGGVISKIILADKNETVLLFRNETCMFEEVSLYIYEDRNEKHIVTWTFKDEFFTVGFADKNYSKIFMDPHRNIHIASIDKNYQKKYFINNFTSSEVDVIVLEKRYFHEGDLVDLFKNVNEPDKEVSLWISNDINYTHIVTWTENMNKSITPAWMVKNYRKIKMDVNGDIWIDNVDVNYNGKYFILNSSRLGVDLIILGSSQLKSDNPTTKLYVIIAVLVAVFVICFIIYIIKCLRKRCRRSHRMNHDRTPNGNLLPRSSPNSTENVIGEEHELQQMSNDIPPIESLLSRSLPNSSENVIRETQRRLRQMRHVILPTEGLLPRSSPNSPEMIIRNRHVRSQQMNHDTTPTGTLLARSSPDSAENVMRETQRRLRQMRHVILPTEGLLPRSSPNSPEIVIRNTHVRSQQMNHDTTPTGTLFPRSSPISSEWEEKGKDSEHEEKSQNPAINLSQEVRKKAYQGNILDIRNTKFVKRSSMVRTVDLHSSKFDTHGKGSEASTKLEHHGMMLRPRKSQVV